PGHYQYNPIKTIKTSVMGAINMLGLAKRLNARILQASTSEVYGDPEIHPQPESYRGSVNPIGIRACYDEGKRAAETLMFDYHRQNKVNVRVVRIFNTYGPRMHPYDGRVVSNFIRQALAGEPITIYGDGSQSRSFCYCDDLLDAIMGMMNGPDDFHGPVNIGNPSEFTIRELAELVVESGRDRGHRGRDRAGPPAAAGRPPAAAARHHARPGEARMGAEGRASRRAPADHRVVPGRRSLAVPAADAALLSRAGDPFADGVQIRQRRAADLGDTTVHAAPTRNIP
ncbi:MAG: NAD-dependent epimerase/dehydratase family protein, partial [Planctomycetota bacterium]